MPRATEFNRLPYESPSLDDAIRRRVAEFEKEEATFAYKRKWTRRFTVACVIIWAMFFMLPYDPGYSNFLGYCGVGLTIFTLITRPKGKISAADRINEIKLILGFLSLAFGLTLLYLLRVIAGVGIAH